MVVPFVVLGICIFTVNGFILDIVEKQQYHLAHTDCGPVIGHLNAAYEYRGIPYALPPTKQRRWKAPEPLTESTNTCWSGIYNASSFGNMCVQSSQEDVNKILGNEDCLYLNIWTPTLSSNANLPVMVWIHGGSLQTGSGNGVTFSPTAELANETNMVYVSMNYRLSAFGFMALDILSKQSPLNVSGNYGFMDQQLALQWVQRNIKNFGGNPELVTVFGQSSGGTSIIGLLSSPLSTGLFHRAWIMSASPVFNKTLREASQDNMLFLKNTGCEDINCLYDLPAEDIIRAIPLDVYPYWAMADQLDPPTYNLFDGAICIVDGYVVPEAPFDMWRTQRGIDVPVIVGTTAQETDFVPTYSNITDWTWDSYKKYIIYYLDTFPGNISKQALALYPTGIETPAFQYFTLTTDVRMTCPNDVMTAVLSSSFKSPVYRYVLTQRPTQPVSLFTEYKTRYSVHTWDILGFFGTLKSYYNTTVADKQFKENIRQEMLAFVRNGKPHSINWEKYPANLALIDTYTTLVKSYHSKMCDFWNRNGFFSYGWVN